MFKTTSPVLRFASLSFFVLLAVGFFSFFSINFSQIASAQDIPDAIQTILDLDSAAEAPEATDSTFTATTSAATTSSTVDPNAKQAIQEKKDQDLTETVNKKTDALTALVLEKESTSEVHWYNFLQHTIYLAIAHGLPANLIVIIILFPLVASIIAFSRHVIGIKGYGIYAPAVLSIAFVSTGIPLGIFLFILIILAATAIKWLLRKISLPHLPKTALLLWGVSVGVLAFLLLAANLNWQVFFQISIFPLLIIMLLSENFMETQLMTSQKEALKLTVETILVAIVGALIISWEPLQKIVILNPGLALIVTALIDILIGKFTGLRLLEYLRFHSLINQKEE